MHQTLPTYPASNMSKKLFAFLLIYIACFSVSAQERIRFSLLTCEPGQAVYELFGHTAIRYEDDERGEDLVFSYGMFSFNTPNFLYRFVKGETDYQLGVTYFDFFQREYAERGTAVYAQRLNLTPAEAEKLRTLLWQNYEPQNRVYRYNYFYDNCTTRARDMIERAVDGTVEYTDTMGVATFRSIVHEYTAGHAWEEFGIDLCLGAQADRPIEARKQMFAPFYTKRFFQTAVIRSSDGTSRPLVAEEKTVVIPTAEVPASRSTLSAWFTPFVVSTLIFILSVIIYALPERKKYIAHAWQGLQCLVWGLAGCVIAYLYCFSIHPTVGSNFLVIVLHPLPLFLLVIWLVRKREEKYSPIRLLAPIVALFLAFSWLFPQDFNISLLPLACSLLVAPLMNYFRQLSSCNK